MIGTLLSNRYRIDAQLGEGGMGVVYRAHDTLLDRPVALKSLAPHLLSAEGLKRLLREAQSAAKLTHPNIVSVYDVIEEGDTRLIVMEYVDGQTLRSLIPLPWQRAVDVALDICRALAFAHGRGTVHRDIKPENVIITSDGAAKVMDFGLARSEGRSRMTQSGMILGTVAYMAPEQAVSGQADNRTDLYSLGCVLYEMITNRPPFEADDPISVISMHVNVPPVAPRFYAPEIPPALESIILRLLAKDPTQRYASAEDLAGILTGALAPFEATSDTTAAVEAQLAAPTLLEMMARGRLVDREEELAALKGSLESMLSGRGTTVLVAGEPGIGKTRLAQEVLVYARLRGCLAVMGSCFEQEVTIPYLPIAEALRAVLRAIPDEQLQTIAGAHAAEVVKLVPELRQRIPDLQPSPPLDPDQERIRLFEHVTAFLAAASRTRPLVMLLDDLHWADAATLQLLRYIARNVRSDRLLLLGTYRDVELDRNHPLANVLREMNRERLYTRILLRRLAPEQVGEMIRAIFQTRQPVSVEFRDLIYRETEGNPFFVEEVLKYLVEVGALYIIEGRWERKDIHDIEVPQSVREVIGRRLERLSSEGVEALTVGSVIGRHFEFELLRTAMPALSGVEGAAGHGASQGADAGRLLDLMEEALESQLINEERTEDGVRYTFAHALVRETLYEGLSLRRKMLLHEKVGEAMERVYAGTLDTHAADLAYHFSQVGRAQAEKAVLYSRRAADVAEKIYAYDEAITHYRAALDILPRDDTRRVEVQERIGEVSFKQGNWAEAAQMFEQTFAAYEARGETGAALQNSLRLAWAYRQLSDPDRALVWAGKAADAARAAGDRRGLGRGLLQTAHALWLKGDYAEAATYAAEANEMATAVDDTTAAVGARVRYLNSLPPWETKGAEDFVAAVASADKAGLTGQRVGARWGLTTLMWMHGANTEETLRINEEALEISRRAGYLFGTAWSLSNMAEDLIDRGDWTRGQALEEESIATYERIGASFGSHYPRLHLAWLRGLRGDFSEALQTLRTLMQSLIAARDAQGQRLGYGLIADLCLAAGQAHEAVTVLDDAIQTLDLPPDDPVYVFFLGVVRATALSQVQRVEEARTTVESALRLIEAGDNRRFAWVGRGIRGKILALSGDWDDAITDFTFAEQSLRAAWRPLYLGRVLRDWGVALSKRGKAGAAEDGRLRLTEALSIFENLGARLDADLTRKVLQS
jgi:tetratricopeptide (TPR) repeat protein